MRICWMYTSQPFDPFLEYAPEVWHPGLTQEMSDNIEHIQERALRIIYPNTSVENGYVKSGLEVMWERREARCKLLFQQISKPDHKLHHLLPVNRNMSRLRSNIIYEYPKVRTVRLKNSPINYGIFKFQS